MTDISIALGESDKRTIQETYSEAVLDRLVNKVATKNDTLQWKSTVESCAQRFYSVIRKDGQIFPVINFSVDQYQYRAVLCWVEEYSTFEFIRVIGKDDHYPNSRHRKVSEQLIQHPHKVASEAETTLEKKQANPEGQAAAD